MAFSSALTAANPPAYSIGPYKEEIFDISAANGDTTGTVTASRLSRIDDIIVTGLQLSAAPVITNGTTCTAALTFVTPPSATTIFGKVVLRGR